MTARSLAIVAGSAAAALVTFGLAIPAGAATTTQTASCTDGGGAVWNLHSTWGAVTRGKVANDVTGFLSTAPAASTVDYSMRVYDGSGTQVQVTGGQDVAIDDKGGAAYFDRDLTDAPSSPGKTKIVVNLGDGNDGYGNCSVTFVQPAAAGASPSPTASATATPTARPTAAASPTVTKVLTIVEENHSMAQMQSGMPYLYSLAKEYSYASDYTAIRHPSLPNYLAIAGGSTFGVTDDSYPSSHKISSTTIFGQAISSGKTAHTYAESMPSNCYLSGNVDKGYAVKHNPWAYFTNERTACNSSDTSAASFDADARANRLPNVGMLVPNKCNDAHDCGLSTADGWLESRLPGVLASSDFTSGRLAVVVTADEDDKNSGNQVLTVVLHASLSHKVVTTPLTHYSLSAFNSQVVGKSGLLNAASAPNMAAAFGLEVS